MTVKRAQSSIIKNKIGFDPRGGVKGRGKRLAAKAERRLGAALRDEQLRD